MIAPETKAPVPALARAFFPLVFGLVLGLAIWKFGNPVILDARLTPPRSMDDALAQPWPPHWSLWSLLPVMLACLPVAAAGRFRLVRPYGLWILPVAWFAWQLAAASRTVDETLTRLTLWHFAGCLICYFAAGWGITTGKALRLMLVGLLAAFAFCLVRAADQKFFEFARDRQIMLEGEQNGWTNFPPGAVAQMKEDGIIIVTNGVEKVSPLILQKYEKARAYGTLIYPNGLAGVILLLLPATLALGVWGARAFRPLTRAAVIGLTLFLGLGSLLWSASKSGWLIALGLLGLAAFRLRWPVRWKWAVVVVVAVVGLGAFGVRFHRYFSSGATSVGARFDYWRAATQTALAHPLAGSGPGTFQRPYARLKRPESEMTRLAHNDYLEQFSDSGFPGGIAYLAWIAFLLGTVGRRAWGDPAPLHFAIFLGLAGWFAQGCCEFGLYIPALSWTAFALAGGLLNVAGPRREGDLRGTPAPSRA